MLTTLLNIVGLILGIIGSVLLFKYGLPEDINKRGLTLLACEGENEEEKKKYKQYKSWGKVGLGFLVVGFVLQFISSIIELDVQYLIETVSKVF